MHAPPRVPSLDDFRAEVLVAVRARGLIIAHDGGERILGWRAGLDGPRALADVFPPDDLVLVESAMSAATGRETVVVGPPVHVLRGDRGTEGAEGGVADGSTESMHVEVVPTDDATIDGWVLRLRPAGAGKAVDRDEALAILLAERFVSLAESLAAGILIGDAVGSVDYANPATRELLWRTDEELAGTGWLDTIHAEDRHAVEAAAERVRRSGTSEVVDFRVDVVGSERRVQARFTTVSSSTGRPGGWVAVLADVTAERATNDELSRQATHDPLTGLPNRALLHDRLTQALARAQRTEAPLAVLFVDLNDFKAINDHHGHRVGDSVLKEVAGRIRAVVRAHDTAARLGGDEFVVVTEGVDADVVHQVATRLGSAVAAPITLDGATFTITCAIGVSWSPGPETTAAELLDRADQAMYEAKRSGHPVVVAPIVTS